MAQDRCDLLYTVHPPMRSLSLLCVPVTCPLCMTNVSVAGNPHKTASSDWKTILFLWLGYRDTSVWICALERGYVVVRPVTARTVSNKRGLTVMWRVNPLLQVSRNYVLQPLPQYYFL